MKYAMNLEMKGRACVVLGGGPVALRKVRTLVRAEADVTVVAPEAVLDLASLAMAGRVRWVRRGYEERDLDGASIVICATNDADVNARAAAAAKARGVLVNAPAQPELSDFTVPASFSRGRLLFTVSTDGGSPGLSRAIRRQLEALYPAAFGDWLETVAALREGARLSIPTMVHESNAVPGLTTRMVEKYMDRIMVSFEDSRASYHDPEKVVVTGTPVREEFLYTRRQAAREKLGLDERPFVVSCWGSLGAREMNKMIAEFMRCEQEAGEPFQHLHATGSFGWRWMPEYVKDLGVDLEKHPSIDMREYIFNMPTCMAAADLIICRAGAATISEVCASALPCIMVPSPNVTNNHQEKNAMVLQGRGAAVVVPEAGCSGKLLFDTATEILTDPARTKSMRQAASSLAVVDSAQRIYETALELIQSR